MSMVEFRDNVAPAARWSDDDHSDMIGRDQGPARTLETCPHVLGFALAYCFVAKPTSIASTNTIAAL